MSEERRRRAHLENDMCNRAACGAVEPTSERQSEEEKPHEVHIGVDALDRCTTILAIAHHPRTLSPIAGRVIGDRMSVVRGIIIDPARCDEPGRDRTGKLHRK